MVKEIINGHIHFGIEISEIENVKEIYSDCGIKKLNIVNTATVGRVNAKNFSSVCFKLKYPDEIYICGGLEYTFLSKDKKEIKKEILKQVENLTKMGFDGVKIIETKPNFLKLLPFKIDDEVYADFFSFIEEKQIPIVWHVADPEDNWDENKIHPLAKKYNWGYFKGEFSKPEEIYRMVENILKRYPNLKIIFSHFLFLSDKLEKAEEILTTYKNVNFDITPGAEMYLNFSKNCEKTREFFLKFQDRIIFGDDGPMGDFTKKLINFIRRFLETEDIFPMIESYGNFLSYEGEIIKGINLPEKVLNKIYFENFINLFGMKPRNLNIDFVLEEINKKENLEEIKKFIENSSYLIK